MLTFYHAIWNFVKSSRPFFLYRVYVSNTQCFKRYKTLLYIILVWDKKNLRLDRIIISTNSPFFISIFLYLHRFSFFLVFSLFVFHHCFKRSRNKTRIWITFMYWNIKRKMPLTNLFFRQVFWPAPKIKGCAIVRV